MSLKYDYWITHIKKQINIEWHDKINKKLNNTPKCVEWNGQYKSG